jgi:hypothetical protein
MLPFGLAGGVSRDGCSWRDDYCNSCSMADDCCAEAVHGTYNLSSSGYHSWRRMKTLGSEATPHVSRATFLLLRGYKRSSRDDEQGASSCSMDPSRELQESKKRLRNGLG